MGNALHTHVHRNNTLDIDSGHIDQMKMEQYNGGVVQSTINNVANASGGLSTRPLGYVNVEDGWNLRRGIGMMSFQVTQNALVETELSILGYLVGGQATTEGISADTIFVPVRSWETSTRNVQDQFGLPTPATVISDSSQFLLQDALGSKSLKSLRPLDIANETLGFLACEQEGVEASYGGTINSDLSKGVLVSKTNNLDPTHHAKQLIQLSTTTIDQQSSGMLENSLADGMNSPGLGEVGVTDNAFFKTMLGTLGTWNTSGFSGWSIGEICSVFESFPDVLNLSLLNESNFGIVDNLANTNEYGGANYHEVLASELAFLTVHLLMSCGLTHLEFSATNNPHDFGGLEGSDDGVMFIPGPCGSVVDNDPNAINRVQRFEQLIKNHFFAKLNTGFQHNSTIVNVEVECSIFGEIKVKLFLNGDPSNTRTWANAAYLINRTSSNITTNENGLQSAKNFVENIKSFF